MMMTGPDGSSHSRSAEAQKAAQKIMSLMANRELSYQSSEIIRRYNTDFAAEIADSHLPRLGHQLYEQAVRKLAREKKIEPHQDGSIKFYNQVVAIKSASARLSAALDETDTLHALAENVTQATGGLFRNFDLYLREAKSGEKFLIAGTGEAP
ncbi:MAG TPA: hypothetical protein VMT55_00530, partial [Candidatus Sulfotelmatobacter sp.]|nr:hypothetical protein [Candidatus Sulfotelmatobacter sp.]